MTIREGGCLCGAVRFAVEGDPIISGACHCRHCQYVAGGGAAYGVMFPSGAVTVTKGEPRLFTVKGESGADVYRHFCPECGVHLLSGNSRFPEFRSVKIGVFDDPAWFRSDGSIWAASAQPWHRVDPDLPSWPQEPPMSAAD